MKSIKTAIAALGFVVAAASTGQAADLTAYSGQKIELGDVNGVAYYTVEKDGYRVVATLSDASSKAVRFEALLAPGQKVVMSSPAGRGDVAKRVEISRRDDRVEINTAPLTN